MESGGDAAERAAADSVANAGAREILAAVAQTAGGQDNLNAIRTLAVQYVHTRLPRTGGNDQPTPAPQLADVLQVRDFDNGRHLYEVYSGTDPEVWERVVMLPHTTFVVNLRTNETTPISNDALAGATYSGLQLRWYVYTVLSEAAAAGRNLRHARDTVLNGRNTHVLTYPGPNTETIQLWVDEQQKVILRRQISATDPILGHAVVRFHFDEYQDVGGIPMPMNISVYDGDRLFERFEIQEIRLNATVQDRAFEPPLP